MRTVLVGKVQSKCWLYSLKSQTNLAGGGQTEVPDLDVIIAVEENVGRLQISERKERFEVKNGYSKLVLLCTCY